MTKLITCEYSYFSILKCNPLSRNIILKKPITQNWIMYKTVIRWANDWKTVIFQLPTNNMDVKAFEANTRHLRRDWLQNVFKRCINAFHLANLKVPLYFQWFNDIKFTVFIKIPNRWSNNRKYHNYNTDGIKIYLLQW